MSEWHIPEELLERFLRLEASRQASQQVVRHLLSGCPQCLDLAHRTALESGLFTPLEEGRKAGWEQAYAEVFTRSLAFATEEEQKLALEKLRGWAQWAQLESCPLSSALSGWSPTAAFIPTGCTTGSLKRATERDFPPSKSIDPH